jgi:hypothetical protein
MPDVALTRAEIDDLIGYSAGGRALQSRLPPCPECARRKAGRQQNLNQAAGGKNTKLRTSMLSRGGAPGVRGLSKDVWNDSRARPSLALSCTRMNSTSSGCMSEK